jgi:hypothetical protein
MRRHNSLRLPADVDGAPTWHNLVADLKSLLEHFRPEVIGRPILNWTRMVIMLPPLALFLRHRCQRLEAEDFADVRQPPA